ncbi:hypothetical protein EJB05_23860, partial [Eragrostis curvula]
MDTGGDWVDGPTSDDAVISVQHVASCANQVPVFLVRSSSSSGSLVQILSRALTDREEEEINKRSIQSKASIMTKAVAMLVVAVALVVVAAMSAGTASAADCKPEQLAVCLPSIISGAEPTSDCCTNLRAQEGCFCQYAKNPAYNRYITSPNARHALTSCSIAIPNCP